MKLIALLILLPASCLAQPSLPLLYLSSSTPANVSQGLKLWLEARLISATNGQSVSVWTDASGNGNNTSQGTTTNRPTFTTLQAPNGLPVVRFNGTNHFLAITGSPITRTQTNWTYCGVGRSFNQNQNNTIFDVTEQTSFESILCRNIFLTASYAAQMQVRDEASHLNAATTTDDWTDFRIMTATRSGSTITLRINGQSVSTNSANTLGAMDSGSYFTTLGAVRNSNPTANYLNGDIYGVCVYDRVLTDNQIVALENYWRTQLTAVTNMVREVSNPVIPFGASNTPDHGRILEPTVLIDGSTWKMWYCGLTNNGGASLGAGWNTLYAESTNGVNWTKIGKVRSGVWEPDVIKVTNTFYMVNVTDSSFGVRIGTSTNGTNWTDSGIIIDLTNSIWSDIGPREPCIYFENSTFYCFYADHATSDGRYKIGLSICNQGTDPTVHSNWVCQSSPVFSSINSPGWNQGGDTESPCVRKYDFTPHPYVMSYIGYNNLTQGAGSFKTWRPAFAVADSISGTWTAGHYAPILKSGTNAQWDDRVIGEMTHVENGGTNWFYYSGGQAGASNQVGLATIPTNNFVRYLQW